MIPMHVIDLCSCPPSESPMVLLEDERSARWLAFHLPMNEANRLARVARSGAWPRADLRPHRGLAGRLGAALVRAEIHGDERGVRATLVYAGRAPSSRSTATRATRWRSRSGRRCRSSPPRRRWPTRARSMRSSASTPCAAGSRPCLPPTSPRAVDRRDAPKDRPEAQAPARDGADGRDSRSPAGGARERTPQRVGSVPSRPRSTLRLGTRPAAVSATLDAAGKRLRSHTSAKKSACQARVATDGRQYPANEVIRARKIGLGGTGAKNSSRKPRV